MSANTAIAALAAGGVVFAAFVVVRLITRPVRSRQPRRRDVVGICVMLAIPAALMIYLSLSEGAAR